MRTSEGRDGWVPAVGVADVMSLVNQRFIVPHRLVPDGAAAAAAAVRSTGIGTGVDGLICRTSGSATGLAGARPLPS